jgi:hypothetical protein
MVLESGHSPQKLGQWPFSFSPFLLDQGSYTSRGIFLQDIQGFFTHNIQYIPAWTISTPRHAAAAEPTDQIFHTVSQKYQQANKEN